MTTPFAPARSSSPKCASLRDVPTTSWPAATSSGTILVPMAPVAPAMNTLMSWFPSLILYDERTRRSVTDSSEACVTCSNYVRASRDPGGVATTHVLDRLPHARQRGRGGRRRAGGASAPRGAGSRASHREPRGVRFDGHHPARDRRPALGTPATRGLRRPMDAGAVPRRRRSTRHTGSSATRRSRSRSSPCSSGSARSNARSSCFVRCSPTTTRDRGIVERDEAACRQILHRAKARIADGRPRFDGADRSRRALADAFFAASRRAMSTGWSTSLADDVVFYGDGGGGHRRYGSRSAGGRSRPLPRAGSSAAATAWGCASSACA